MCELGSVPSRDYPNCHVNLLHWEIASSCLYALMVNRRQNTHSKFRRAHNTKKHSCMSEQMAR